MGTQEIRDIAGENGLLEIHCSGCGRFLGYGTGKDVEVYLLCKNCHRWTVFVLGDKEMALTGKAMYDKVVLGR